MRISLLFLVLFTLINCIYSDKVFANDRPPIIYKKKVVRQEQVQNPKIIPELPKGIGCPKCIEQKPKQNSNPNPKPKTKTKQKVTPSIPKNHTVSNVKPAIIKRSSISLEVLSGSVNQENLFCNYSSYIYFNIKDNISTKTLNENICPPIIVEFVLHKNSEISNVRIISSGDSKTYANELFDAVSKVDLKNVKVTLPSNASNYAKARVILRGYNCRR